MDIEVVIEIPRGSRNKYELDHRTGEVWLDRTLFTATVYPVDYGFVAHTLAEDGDPLDAMVLLGEPAVPGCHIWARPVGVFRMSDEKGQDDKLLCVPSRDPRWSAVHDVTDVADYQLSEIGHFFDVYKSLEPGKATEIDGWRDRAAAEQSVEEARQRAIGG